MTGGKGVRAPALVLWASLLCGAALAQDAPPVASPDTPPAATVVAAVRSQVVETVEASGTLVAREEVAVTPALVGPRIVEVLVDEGDVVEAGDVLARLDPADAESRLARSEAQIARAEAARTQAEAQVAQAEAQAAEAEVEAGRSRQLAESGTVADAALDQSETSVRTAQAQADAARAAVGAAEADIRAAGTDRDAAALDVARADVVAPSGGLVLRREASVGGASTGAPLFTIAEGGTIELEARAMETDLARIAVGDPVRVALPGGEATGTVRRIAPGVDEATRLGAVRIALDEGTARPPAGAFARATVEVGRREAVTVPLGAVLTGDAGDSVAVVASAEDGTATVERRAVEAGAVVDGRVEIVTGLADGERVLARAGAFFRDGDRVTPVRDDAPAAPVSPAVPPAVPPGQPARPSTDLAIGASAAAAAAPEGTDQGTDR